MSSHFFSPSVVQALRDATLEMLEDVRLQMSDLVYRRARHSVSEDRRTLSTVKALEDKDYATVGEFFGCDDFSTNL